MFLHDNKYSSFGNRFDFSCENCNCSKAPNTVTNVLLLWLPSYTTRRFTMFGVDSVQTGQTWIAHHNKCQWYGGCRFCSGNHLFLSSHSQYKFLKNVQNCLNSRYIYIYIYVYIYIYNVICIYVQTGCSRNRGFRICFGNSLLCVTAVTVVCSSDVYCVEC